MAKQRLKKIDPDFTGDFRDKEDAEAETAKLQQELYNQLYMMFAEGKRSLLIILHGIDTSGKDGTVRHIFNGSNPQGLRVHSFKKPSEEELRHDFLWRCHRMAPEAGTAVIFNRSYYEEVTTVRVHPEMLKSQYLPDDIVKSKTLFEDRYTQINRFEKMLHDNGTRVVKFLMHISKSEQKIRLEERIKDPTKNWKFSEGDIEERKFWDEYMDAFQDMVDATGTKHSPWHIVPANQKWYRNYMVSKTLVDALSSLKMKFPKIETRSAMKRLN